MTNSRLVYSSSDGDLRKDGRPGKTAAGEAGPPVPNDGIVRVFRETGGRRGKVVTVVRGLPASGLIDTAGELKRLCGTGGAVKNGALELQGDHRDKVAARLVALGHVVKLAGG